MVSPTKENNNQSWREFQANNFRPPKKKESFIKKLRFPATILILTLLITSIFLLNIESPQQQTSPKISDKPSEEPKETIPSSSINKNSEISKNQLFTLLSGKNLAQETDNTFKVHNGEKEYTIITSINTRLQNYLHSLQDKARQYNMGKPRFIAFVVMEPHTGKIIAMSGYNEDKPHSNPCLESDYPAASIFKLVTAAAAVETLGYNPYTPLYFTGNKYTLYKRQLREVKNKKHAYRISFSRAFAQSVNPVFGKIGKIYLGKETLETYASTFGFNQLIPYEQPFISGKFEIHDDEFHLAELGSGFNRDTTISPVFVAMLTSAIINRGKLMTPGIVEQVTSSDDKILYTHKPSTYTTAITPKTAQIMMQLMGKTISEGTARKYFRGSSKDPVLSKLIIGGKTGSLSNREHTVKYDWFTGFGKQKKGKKAIAIAVVVGHQKYIGTRSTIYAHRILKRYFQEAGN